MSGIEKGQTRKYSLELIDTYVKIYKENSNLCKSLLDAKTYESIKKEANKRGIKAQHRGRPSLNLTKECIICGKIFETNSLINKQTCGPECAIDLRGRRQCKTSYKCFDCVNWYAGNAECGKQAFSTEIKAYMTKTEVIQGIVQVIECQKFKGRAVRK